MTASLSVAASCLPVRLPASLPPTNRPGTGNMMLFNSEGVIQKYATPEDILREFYDLRLQFYAKRRAALLRVSGAAACGEVLLCWGCLNAAWRA